MLLSNKTPVQSVCLCLRHNCNNLVQFIYLLMVLRSEKGKGGGWGLFCLYCSDVQRKPSFFPKPHLLISPRGLANQ